MHSERKRSKKKQVVSFFLFSLLLLVFIVNFFSLKKPSFIIERTKRGIKIKANIVPYEIKLYRNKKQVLFFKTNKKENEIELKDPGVYEVCVKIKKEECKRFLEEKIDYQYLKKVLKEDEKGRAVFDNLFKGDWDFNFTVLGNVDKNKDLLNLLYLSKCKGNIKKERKKESSFFAIKVIQNKQWQAYLIIDIFTDKLICIYPVYRVFVSI